MTDGRKDGRTDQRTEGWTDGGDCNIPIALKKRGDIYASRGADLVPIKIPTICLFTLELNLTRAAVDGTPLQIPAFSLNLTLGSWSHKMLPSTLYIM